MGYENSIKKSLIELYQENWSVISNLKRNNQGLSGPLLINPSKLYLSQKLKLMIIGQQTQGWSDGEIDDLLDYYGKFNFGQTHHPSPFWNMTRKIEKILSIDKYAIAWSNLNRCDFNNKRPPHEIEQHLSGLSNLLHQEVNILNPDVVIFFSGYAFDEHIKKSFINAHFESVDGFTNKELAKIKHESLPFNTYRTYHPKYLRISQLEPRIIEFIRYVSTIKNNL